MLKPIFYILVFLTSVSLIQAQSSDYIECNVSGNAYSEKDGYHITAVDTSQQLEFIFKFENSDLMSSCKYFIELHFKPDFPSRSAINEKWYNGENRIVKDSVMTLKLSPYLLIPVSEAIKLIGY